MPLDPAIVADLLACAAAAQSFDPATTHYLAALTSDPSDVAQGTECTGDGYARCVITPADVMELVGGSWQNASDITFNPATTDWPEDIVALAAYPAAEGASGRVWYFILATPKTVTSGNALRIPAGDLTVAYAS